jgi:hypothetical protein
VSAAPDFRPIWLDEYLVSSSASRTPEPNASFLNDLRDLPRDPGTITAELEKIYDRQSILNRRQQYADLNRDYEMRKRAGLIGIYQEQAHLGQLSGFSNDVWQDMQNRKLQQAGDKATRIAEKNEVAAAVAAPAVLLYGVYIGTPIRLKVAEDARFNLSTNFRGKTGSFQFDSPALFGSIDFRPMAPGSRDLVTPTGVDFGAAMQFERAIDFSQEQVQITLSRPLPVFGLTSSVLYGSSSKAVVGSLSKRLTDHMVCVVDSIHGLSPTAQSSEQKFRLRYDIAF